MAAPPDITNMALFCDCESIAPGVIAAQVPSRLPALEEQRWPSCP